MSLMPPRVSLCRNGVNATEIARRPIPTAFDEPAVIEGDALWATDFRKLEASIRAGANSIAIPDRPTAGLVLARDEGESGLRPKAEV